MIIRFNMSIVLTALTAVCAASAMYPGHQNTTADCLKNVARFSAKTIAGAAIGAGIGFVVMKGVEKFFGKQIIPNDKKSIALMIGSGIAAGVLAGFAVRAFFTWRILSNRHNAVFNQLLLQQLGLQHESH